VGGPGGAGGGGGAAINANGNAITWVGGAANVQGAVNP
jgi:hypothetical protein